MALADYPPFQGPYDQPDSHTVDAIASSIAIMPSLGVAGVCGALTLPADVYWKLQRPDDAFGAHAAEQLCIYPAAAVGRSVYLAAGFPFFAGKKVFWDLPRSRSITAPVLRRSPVSATIS